MTCGSWPIMGCLYCGPTFLYHRRQTLATSHPPSSTYTLIICWHAQLITAWRGSHLSLSEDHKTVTVFWILSLFVIVVRLIFFNIENLQLQPKRPLGLMPVYSVQICKDCPGACILFLNLVSKHAVTFSQTGLWTAAVDRDVPGTVFSLFWLCSFSISVLTIESSISSECGSAVSVFSQQIPCPNLYEMPSVLAVSPYYPPHSVSITPLRISPCVLHQQSLWLSQEAWLWGNKVSHCHAWKIVSLVALFPCDKHVRLLLWR